MTRNEALTPTHRAAETRRGAVTRRQTDDGRIIASGRSYDRPKYLPTDVVAMVKRNHDHTLACYRAVSGCTSVPMSRVAPADRDTIREAARAARAVIVSMMTKAGV